MSYKFLSQISSPQDLKTIAQEDLPQVAQELRDHIIQCVAQTGGHLGPSLGVVELTLALHYVFNTPDDRLVWDVGHQSYAHKVLTGRRDALQTIRQVGGLSGFTKRSESIYDPFGTAHSSTSISAALGMAIARDFNQGTHHSIAVIGDGAMSAGMAYEAMNNAGFLKSNLLVILNDNDMSIAKPVGAMSTYLSRLITSKTYNTLRKVGKSAAKYMPESMAKRLKKMEEFTKGMVSGGTLFEELGFCYLGPLDGHKLDDLIAILKNIKSGHHQGPVLLHLVTQKGKGYAPAEAAEDKLHGVSKFNVATGAPLSSSSSLSYTQVFAQKLLSMAQKDEKIIAITAAMPTGTGLDLLQQHLPERTFDVGIAEQHALTFAAGLATEGFKPFVAIYSTFMQRAYDQVVHDIVLQSLPVRMCMDRAGLVGNDGATHHGAYDLAYLSCLPGMVLLCPSSQKELESALDFMWFYDQGPSAVRYPRGTAEQGSTGQEVWKLGEGFCLSQGKEILLISLGTRLQACQEAIEALYGHHKSITLIDARFAKPLKEDFWVPYIQAHQKILIVEEAAYGGFGAAILNLCSQHDLSYHRHIKVLSLPDQIIDHDEQKGQWKSCGIDSQGIMQALQTLSKLN